MNYEAGTEERKGLTKCLNFKRPETILRVRAARPVRLRANIYGLFPRISRTEDRAAPSCRDLERARARATAAAAAAAAGRSPLVGLSVRPSVHFLTSVHPFPSHLRPREHVQALSLPESKRREIGY